MADPFVGEIKLWPSPKIPVDWHVCDGSLVSVQTYQVLFSLLGTIYGGDGVTTFGLPNLQGKLPIGQGTGAGLTQRVIGQTGGASEVTLTEAEMSAHSHTLTATSANATQVDPTNAVLGIPAITFYEKGAAGPTKIKNLSPLAVDNTGGTAPHNNLMPYMALNYIISLSGLYPQRP